MSTTTTTPTAADATPAPAPASSAAPAPKAVPTRRISFEESLQTIPRHFARDGDLLDSHIIAALSSLFPDGEDFFVRSVRNYRDRITDPVLRKQVAGFIGQESVHGREHRAFNARLAELGYPTRGAEAFTRGLLRLADLTGPKIARLSITAAAEHFTATLAEMVMEDGDFRARTGHQAVTDLFTWHALEESEHKAVAFDVYRAVGGPEWRRIATMKFVRPVFALITVGIVLVSLLRDPATYRIRPLWASLRGLKHHPMLSKELRRRLRTYDRKGFHPDDIDTLALEELWRDRLFGDDGELNRLLAGASAA